MTWNNPATLLRAVLAESQPQSILAAFVPVPFMITKDSQQPSCANPSESLLCVCSRSGEVRVGCRGCCECQDVQMIKMKKKINARAREMTVGTKQLFYYKLMMQRIYDIECLKHGVPSNITFQTHFSLRVNLRVVSCYEKCCFIDCNFSWFQWGPSDSLTQQTSFTLLPPPHSFVVVVVSFFIKANLSWDYWKCDLLVLWPEGSM